MNATIKITHHEERDEKQYQIDLVQENGIEADAWVEYAADEIEAEMKGERMLLDWNEAVANEASAKVEITDEMKVRKYTNISENYGDKVAVSVADYYEMATAFSGHSFLGFVERNGSIYEIAPDGHEKEVAREINEE